MIAIPNMDMPKSCGGCEFNCYLEGGSYEWWECVIIHDDINQFDTRRTDCPLVEIPTPHGRLIDGDKLCNEFSNRCPGDCGCCGESRDDIYDCGLIINAPTILEEEK